MKRFRRLWYGMERALWRAFDTVMWPFRTAQRLNRDFWQWIAASWQFGDLRNLVFGLPALIAVIGVGWLWAAARIEARTISATYNQEAETAIREENYEAAEIYLRRVLEVEPDTRAEFMLGEMFEKTGRSDRAQWIFRKLAPDGEQGFGPAHRKRAMELAETIGPQSSGADIQNLRWHLSLAGLQDSPQVARAWAAYYLALNQYQPAIERLEIAITEYPELGMLLGQLYVAQQKVEPAQRVYLTASKFFRERLDKDPEQQGARVGYANTLLKLGQLDECESVLLVGLKLDPDGPYRTLLASLFTNRHDEATRIPGVSVSDLLALLHRALSYDPNFLPAYERLLGYGQAEVQGDATLDAILTGVIAEGREPGLAHFAMSVLLTQKNDLTAAKWHLERAHHLIPTFPFVGNNLAWLLATEEPRDLDRALQIVTAAAEQSANEPRILDTKAQILIDLKRWTEAYDVLELALKAPRPPVAQVDLHAKLEVVCRELKLDALANEHRKFVELHRPAAPPAETPAEATGSAAAPSSTAPTAPTGTATPRPAISTPQAANPSRGPQ